MDGAAEATCWRSVTLVFPPLGLFLPHETIAASRCCCMWRL